MRRIFRLLLAGVMIAALSHPAKASADWLTDSEREFFQAMGMNVTVGGKLFKENTEFSRLPDIARRAPDALRHRIERIYSAMEKSQPTEAEKAQFAAYMRNGQEVVKKQMGRMLLGGLLGRDSFDMARDAANGIMREGEVSKAWDLQRQWIQRGLNARKDADAALDEITAELARRSGASRKGADMGPKLVVMGRQLKVEGKAGDSAMTEPVIQLRLFKNSTKGQWTGVNVASMLLGKAMGLDYDAQTSARGSELAVAQERKMNLPMILTMPLPTLKAGETVSIDLDLPATVSMGLDHVEMRVWCAEGWYASDNLPGLDLAQKQAARLVQKGRAQPSRTRQRPQPQPESPAGRNRDANGGSKAKPEPVSASRPAEGPAFQKCPQGMALALAPRDDKTNLYTFPACVTVGKGYPANGKSVQIEYDSRIPLKAIAQNDDTFVAIGRDNVKNAVTLMLIPKDQVADVIKKP